MDRMPIRVIGIMSGTSLDGLDLAYCEFSREDELWRYRIHAAETVPYTPEWKHRLASTEAGSAFDLALTDSEYGHLVGKCAQNFILKHSLAPDLIASHGHTIFHQPQIKLTCQIGKGSAIAAETGIPVVSDFRSTDVARGGQGAPLVPAGDRLLFGGYDYCLNIGGFANISFDEGDRRIAYDICPANIILNRLAERAGKSCDEDGLMARTGTIQKEILSALDALPYYSQPWPKSLGKEWLIREILPLAEASRAPVSDLLATLTEHIAGQIARALGNPGRVKKLLITGGGAWNLYLIERLSNLTNAEIIIPDAMTVNFKEALIFAFLGVLRMRGEPNCLVSVTGASSDSCGGAVYQ